MKMEREPKDGYMYVTAYPALGHLKIGGAVYHAERR
jgi:hypothetical protein